VNYIREKLIFMLMQVALCYRY